MQLGVWGSAVSSHSVSGAEPQPKLNLVHFSCKIWHLVAAILMIFLRIIYQSSKKSINPFGRFARVGGFRPPIGLVYV